MVRSIAALFFTLGLCVSLSAEPVCVACEEPAVTYACTFDASLRDASLKLGHAIDGHVCEKVLAKTGPHARCHLMETSAPCEGNERTVTLADYQVAMAGDVESTYEPGMIEIARRRVHATWVCVTSMFNDC